MAIILWEFWLLYQIFFLSQVKRSVIISNKHGIYGSPHQFPNNLSLLILENLERSEKSQNFIEL